MYGQIAVIAAIAAISLSTTAEAAGDPPRAQTGAATLVTQNSATLNATVDPRGQRTTYHFEYGRNKENLASRTKAADAGAGKSPVKVTSAIARLNAGVTFFFRVVAESPGGITRGTRRSFTTAKATASVTLTGPTIVTYGRSATLTGIASGPGSRGARAVLQQSPFPFSSPFGPLGNPTQTGTDGSFALTAPAVLSTTRFRVHVATKPEAVSPVVEVPVRVAVSLRVSDATPRRHQRVRFFGSVRPPHPGATLSIQKRVSSGRYVTVARTKLGASDGIRSRYSRRIRILSTARYRVRALVRDGDHVSGSSRSRRMPVH